MKWKDVLKQEWEIRPCWSGTDCWCRRICTKGGRIIVDGAFITKEMASYFVALHNKRLRDERGYHGTLHNIQHKRFEKIKFYDDDFPFERDEYSNFKRDENDELIEIVSPFDRMNTKWKVIKSKFPQYQDDYCIKTEDGYAVIDIAVLNSKEARYLTKLHNHFLKEKKKWQ